MWLEKYFLQDRIKHRIAFIFFSPDDLSISVCFLTNLSMATMGEILCDPNESSKRRGVELGYSQVVNSDKKLSKVYKDLPVDAEILKIIGKISEELNNCSPHGDIKGQKR